jgi:hypothetical protein
MSTMLTQELQTLLNSHQDAYREGQSENTPPPSDGEYEAMLTRVKVAATKKGSAMISLVLKVIGDPNFDGYEFTQRYFAHVPSSMGDLSTFAVALARTHVPTLKDCYEQLAAACESESPPVFLISIESSTDDKTGRTYYNVKANALVTE